MTDNIASWLETQGLGRYLQAFIENDIDLKVLPHLSDDDLKELGLSLGHRRLLQGALKEGQQAAPADAGQTPEDERRDVGTTEAERRQITVMFCDLVGSTALSSRFDPEDMRAIIVDYHRCCTDLIERHGGFVAKYMGDGVLAYFGYPNAHEHDAERAVQAGLSLVEAAPALTTAADAPLQVRVGIATGTVVVGDLVGSGEAQERGIVGETPNLAARLQSVAEPGMVVIADDTRRLLGNLFDLDDLGSRELKGIQGPSRAWAVLRASTAESRFEALYADKSVALVGREEEADLLARRWARAKSGEGQVVLLSGEPGIGKSHLIAALMSRVAEEPHTRLRYFCSPTHIDSALHPVIVQVGRAAGLEGGDTNEERLDKLDALFAKTSTPDEDAALLAEMLSVANDGRYPTLELTPNQRRQRTLQALVTQIEALTQDGPVLIVFEDAHWTDPTSLELFGLVINRLESLPVLMVVSSRPEFDAPWIGQSHVTALTLSRLGGREVGAMIDRVIGDRQLPVGLRENIIERTDGIPLFVEEITKAVLEAESDRDAQRTAADAMSPTQAVPASLHASLVARLDRLGPAKEVVQTGAAIGREFSHALLAAATPRPEDELERALDRLLEAGLISRQGSPPHAIYLFKHALVQDAAYGLLLREPRRVLHARIGEALETRFPDAAAAEPEIVAYHFARAEHAGPACTYFERAGDRSAARSAFAEATAHFNAALAQTSDLPPGPDRDERELAILFKLGQSLMILKGQRSAEVEETYRQAYEIAKTTNDDQRLFKALWGLWLHANVNSRTDVARERAEELVELGMKSGKEELVLEAVHCRWSTANFRGDVAGTLADAREGLKMYDPGRHGVLGAEFGAHDPGVCAHIVHGFAYAQSGRPRATAESIGRAITLSRTLDHLPSVAFALMNALTSYQMIGDRDAVARVATQTLELAEEFDLAGPHAIASFMKAWSGTTGDGFDRALASMEQEFPRAAAMTSMPFYHTGVLASVRIEAGQTTLALDLLDGVLETVAEPGVGFYLPEIHRLRGNCLWRAGRGEIDDAVTEFETACALAKQQQACGLQLAAAIDLARAHGSADRREEGIPHLREAISLFTDDDVPPLLAVAQDMLSSLPQ